MPICRQFDPEYGPHRCIRYCIKWRHVSRHIPSSEHYPALIKLMAPDCTTSLSFHFSLPSTDWAHGLFKAVSSNPTRWKQNRQSARCRVLPSKLRAQVVGLSQTNRIMEPSRRQLQPASHHSHQLEHAPSLLSLITTPSCAGAFPLQSACTPSFPHSITHRTSFLELTTEEELLLLYSDSISQILSNTTTDETDKPFCLELLKDNLELDSRQVQKEILDLERASGVRELEKFALQWMDNEGKMGKLRKALQERGEAVFMG